MDSHLPAIKQAAEVRRVLWITLALNVLVAAAKIAVGLLTGALAITADGFHSLMDGAGNVIALITSRIATRPPDATHPYGHRRIETIGALSIGVLLLLTAYEIVRSAIERLTSGAEVDTSLLAFLVIGLTLPVNLFVAIYERREGKRLNSEILLADAANTTADVFVTLSVLASMILTALGIKWADPAVALLIVALIARAAFQILRSTGDVLTDRAPLDSKAIIAVAAGVPSVKRVIRARSRGPSDEIFVDIEIELPPETTADHAAAIAEAVRRQVCERYPGVREVNVGFEPLRGAEPDYALAVRAQADALGMSTHSVRLADTGRKKVLELHVEVPGNKTLAEAHDQVTLLEDELRRELPEVGEVITHIEPVEAESPAPAHSPTAAARIKAMAAALLKQHYPDVGWHHEQVMPMAGGCAFAAHAALPPDISLEDAHMLADNAERTLREAIPELQRVIIHTEPEEHA
ncbi:MAG: cation diffusion facilitator family transporter [Anaerolineae bacterium]|nr:cation diffusion facilitator family transporter [Anaerolineae bacterium]